AGAGGPGREGRHRRRGGGDRRRGRGGAGQSRTGLPGAGPRERHPRGGARAVARGQAPVRRQRHRAARRGAPAGARRSTRRDRRRGIRHRLGEQPQRAPGGHPGRGPRRRPGGSCERARRRRAPPEIRAVNPHPRLRGDLVLLERVYRGEQTLLVKDPPNQKYFRFGPLEALVLQAFDGRATPAGIARELEAEGVRVPEAAVQAFARKLGRMGLLERSLAERTTLELERLRAERRRRRRLFRGELLRMRWSIGDPDRFFTRTIPYLRWCFTPGFVAASVALFAVYFAVLGLTWTQFGATVRALYAPAALTPGTVAVLWCSIVVVVGLHELGHGYTCKHFGGEVHEMGFMLVYFEPAFYCNVNDAWSFPEL